MTGINLVTREEKKPPGSAAREWISCIVAIILLLLIYIGLIAYNRFLIKNADNLTNEYESQYSYLLENGKNVFDFQNRLEAAKPLVKKKNYALEGLVQIGKAIIPEVYAESFNFDAEKGQIDLTCVARHYGLVANQVSSLKKMDYFSEVAINETNTRDDGQIEFILKLTIKDN